MIWKVNPNQWGVTAATVGSLCMNVTTFNNETYATDATAPEFAVTWIYNQGPETAPVHAFPNCKVASQVFPASFNNIDKLMLDLEWTYGLGNNTAVSTSKADLEKNLVNTNVAIDIFADPDQNVATDTEKAKMEIMVWFAAYGPATQPLGMATTGIVETQVVEGISFDLYTGENAAGQKVFTWYSATPIHNYTGDLMPLMDILLAKNDPDYPSTKDYIGYMSLGSEALSANSTVTFHVPTLAIDVELKQS
ncbi:hypothetical protein NLU13_6279 [Sarocladium strictum]|uniref:Uncharacterized protein n=1 Tax=Sarocladium strictum TaxID=5046 RepID=A0AA39GGW3_SARSR|nr:hypothetical protein NLU13_6279 [Sarocladium strictum]